MRLPSSYDSLPARLAGAQYAAWQPCCSATCIMHGNGIDAPCDIEGCLAHTCRTDQTTVLNWTHKNNPNSDLTLKTGQEARELARQLMEGDDWWHLNMASGPFEWAAGYLGMPYKRALDVLVGQYAAIAAGPSEAFFKVAAATMHTLDDGTSIRIYTHPMTGDALIDTLWHIIMPHIVCVCGGGHNASSVDVMPFFSCSSMGRGASGDHL